MKAKLYLEVEGSLNIKAFTDKKQVKPVDRIVLLDMKTIGKILDIQEKWAAQQLILNGLWKGASFVEE